MSVKQFYHMMQQGTSRQFDKFNADWGTNGWFTDVMEYDVTKITTPLYTNLL